MSHALLLRLFLSPSFFSVNVALQYLALYSDHIGITYYLTRRLKEYGSTELRDVWGFLCHLLVTRPSKSRALECLITDVSERSTHMAMFTLWFMQAHLRDLSSSKRDTKSFAICQRVLHRCHELIFEDAPGLVSGPYGTMKVRSQTLLHRKRVKHHIEPALVGIGCVLSGAPGLPTISEIVGRVAIEQGREDDINMQGFEVRTETTERRTVPEVVDEDGDDEAAEDKRQPEITSTPTDDRSSPFSEQHDEDTVASRRRRTVEAAQTTPAFSSSHNAKRRYKASSDPFGQMDPVDTPATPYQSSPSFPSPKRMTLTASSSQRDVALRDYDLKAQRLLLRSNYCRSEVQFILALESISNRLLVIPKPARVSALRAELTSLNHKLPAEVCMPMWCTGDESVKDAKGRPKAHHRIVRLPPGESIVLNSAERAPYLLYLEVLDANLDFDPSSRDNREVLRIIVGDGTRSAKLSRATFGPSSSIDAEKGGLAQQTTVAGERSLTDDTSDDPGLPDGQQAVNSSPTVDSACVKEDEEVDLVEQVYGQDLSVHQVPDLSENLVLSRPPKNRALDIATWSSSSLPPSPSLTPHASVSEPPKRRLPDSGTLQSGEPVSFDSGLPDTQTNTPILSLDDYSERMRTAAVMLAQLNASLAKDPVPASRPEVISPPSVAAPVENGSSWIPMSNWLNGVSSTDTSGPLHPSLSGKLRDPSKNAQVGSSMGSNRVKLPAADVAAIRERIMQEMLSLEEERMGRMQAHDEYNNILRLEGGHGTLKTVEDEQIIRRELNRLDPSAVVFQEAWTTKKSRIRHGSPYGHLASWDCVSVIVKTGDLRQEQLAVQLIREFDHIWQDEKCSCWLRPFQIVITGGTSGLVETITDAVSIHSIKKAQYARRLTEGRLGQVTLLDHFISTYGDTSSAKFARAQRSFVRSLAGYSIITYLLQIKDRHNGNILLDRDGHLIHIDFGFMLSNSPGNIGFEAAPFKLTFDYVEVLGGVDSDAFREFKRLFHEGFEAAKKHCDRIIAIVELMQKESSLPCFLALGEQTSQQLRDRFQPKASQLSTAEYVERLIVSSLGSNWTRLYDSYQYYAQSIL